jgi:branched-subunit amino acid ABC-type transport system permease component
MNIAPSRFIQIGAITYVIALFTYGRPRSSIIPPLLAWLAFAGIIIIILTFYEPARDEDILTLILFLLTISFVLVMVVYASKEEAIRTNGRGKYTSYMPMSSTKQGLAVQPLCAYVRDRLAEGWHVYVTQRGEYVVVTPGGREAYSFLLEKDAVEFLSRALGASAEEVKFAACP